MSATTVGKKRTAVLVVHGIGSQRPLETMRGFVTATWLEGDTNAQGKRRVWSHPERSGSDIDLIVMTTNAIPETGGRTADFHELYWAHFMSETRAVAVLLWLFELVRKGPRLKQEMKALWWGTAIFLSCLILSVSLLAVRTAELFAAVSGEYVAILMTPLLMIVVASGAAAIVSLYKGALRLALWSCLIVMVTAVLFLVLFYLGPWGEKITINFIAVLTAVVVGAFVMGPWGLCALACAYALSWGFLLLQVWFGNASFAGYFAVDDLPWSTSSNWSLIAALQFIALYLLINAAFLQSYLGDAARYFRGSPANVEVRRTIRKYAVESLEKLHTSGLYDRIIVVANSLGTVIAYDMMRAYYSRINQDLPRPDLLGPDFNSVDKGELPPAVAREKGREIIREIAAAISNPKPGTKPRPWFVTDFVALGSPLTHALYLMCNGGTEAELQSDFDRRVRERELPTCPPAKIDSDGCLTFKNPRSGERTFHHGGLFALTRWTNIYFPMSQLFWGDAIGGPVKAIFGENIADTPVATNNANEDQFFNHTEYWNIGYPDGMAAPHISALLRAIDLADAGTANNV